MQRLMVAEVPADAIVAVRGTTDGEVAVIVAMMPDVRRLPLASVSEYPKFPEPSGDVRLTVAFSTILPDSMTLAFAFSMVIPRYGSFSRFMEIAGGVLWRDDG